MRRIWSRLRDKPLERRVTLSTAAAVAVAILLSNVAGYAALRTTLFHASQSIAESIARDLVVPAADSLRTTGQLDARVAQAGGVVVEAVAADGSVRRVPGEATSLVLEPADTRAAAPAPGRPTGWGSTRPGPATWSRRGRWRTQATASWSPDRWARSWRSSRPSGSSCSASAPSASSPARCSPA